MIFERKRKILLVDDEPALLMALKIRLEANGFNILEASDGQMALDKAMADKPDLIILDVMLPKIDGYAICKTLKTDASKKTIPIIILSARAQTEDAQKAKEAGADAYLTKPIKSDILLAKVNELLKK
ncbi:MAG: response regulator [Candidatus Omnitrophota bacterium]